MKVFHLKGASQETKNEFMNYLEKCLISQCIEQHREKDITVIMKGGVENYEIHHENDDDYISIQYKNGEVWEYRDIDFGADGMEYKRVK